MIPDSECFNGVEQSLNYLTVWSLISSEKLVDEVFAIFPTIISSPLTSTPGLMRPSISSLS